MEFSQQPKRASRSMKDVPEKPRPHPAGHAQHTKRTQGIALVVVLLSAMVLMVSMLAISATMAISSQRATADQNITLQAQYAAEAGIARANYGISEAYTVMSQLTVTTTSSSASIVNEQLKTHTRNYCNGTYVAAASKYDFYRNWNSDEKRDGIPLCGTTSINNKVGTANLPDRFSLFGTYVPTNAYPTGITPAAYWPTVFTPPAANITTRVASNATNSTESWYTIQYGANDAPITPTRAVLIRPNYYRYYFRVNQGGISATGEVRTGNRILASRIVEKQMALSNTESYIDVELPSFARNFVFRNQTTNTSGGQLYFAGGESFDGPVHTNGTPGFYKLSGQTPVFSDDFTSCATNGTYVGYSSTPTSAELKQTFTGGSPAFGVNCIGMPDNSYNQLRAAYGGDVGKTDPVTCADLASKWGLKVSSSCKSTFGTAASKNQEYDAVPTGVYYSKGNPNSGSTGSPNSSNTWNSEISENGGGLYIKGDVSQLKLSVQTSGTNSANRLLR